MKRKNSNQYSKLPPRIKFEELFIPEPMSGCWIWIGSNRGSRGSKYGKFDGPAGSLAHRNSWFIYRGKHPPKNLFVCHKCDNGLCVNPDHLFLGTAKENMADCIKKGRFTRNPRRGEKVKTSKLTRGDVNKIRERYRSGGISQRSLAKKYGVEQTNISQIIREKIWKTIP